MISHLNYLLIAVILFALGLVGFVSRRNLVLVFLSTELMFQGIILALVAFNRYWLLREGPSAGLGGQSFALLLIAVAAAEAALALIIVIALSRQRHTMDTNAIAEMKG